MANQSTRTFIGSGISVIMATMEVCKQRHVPALFGLSTRSLAKLVSCKTSSTKHADRIPENRIERDLHLLDRLSPFLVRLPGQDSMLVVPYRLRPSDFSPKDNRATPALSKNQKGEHEYQCPQAFREGNRSEWRSC